MKVTRGDLLSMAKDWATALETTKQLEIPPSIVETMQKLYLHEKQRQCLEHYRCEMNSILADNPRGMADDCFKPRHNEIMEKSLLKMGNRENTFGSTEAFDSIFSQLELQLQEEGKTFIDLNLTRFQRQIKLDELEAQKRQRVFQANNVLLEAETDLQTEQNNLQEIHRNRETYTTTVNTNFKYTHHLFGIDALPTWKDIRSREEDQFDENKFNLAVVSQELKITQRQQRVNDARRELEDAQTDLDTFLSKNV